MAKRNETAPAPAPGRGTEHIADGLRHLAVPIDTLVLDPKNARRHDQKNLEAIRASLQRFGQRLPLVVQREGMVVRAGNGRLQVMREMGWTHAAALVVDDAAEVAAAFAIADNRTGELAGWDDAALASLIESLPSDLRAVIGFDEEELNTLAASLLANDGLVDEDAVPAPPDAARSKPGDIWVLGNHRLMCGDSASAADVDVLLAGARIHLVNTDPPYNVKVEPRSNNAIAAGLSSFTATQRKDASAGDQQSADLHRHPEKSKATHKKLRAKDRPLANDFVSDEAFDELLAGWFGNIARVLMPGGTFYIWGGYANCGNYPPVLKACGLYFAQAIIWDKQHPVLTRKDFMGAHEWCFYGWKEGAAHRFFGPNNATDLWAIKKVTPQAMVHLTEKPVELARRAIEYSSKPGENVLDLFAGSGSTLIACEQTGRRCFTIDIDPLYVDVVVERWEKFTGRKAVHCPAAKEAARDQAPADASAGS